MRLNYAFVVIIACIVSAKTPTIHGANILGVFLGTGPSHLIVHMSVARALAEQGHNVTVVTSLETKIKHKNIHNVMIPLSVEQKQAVHQQMYGLSTQKMSIYRLALQLIAKRNPMTHVQFELLKDPRFTDLYERYKDHFDLALIGYLLNDFKLVVAAKFKIPTIVLWSAAPMDIIDSFVGNPRDLAYVPTLSIPVETGARMTFRQRVENVVSYAFMKAFSAFYDRSMKNYYIELAAHDKLPTFEEMKRNVSVVLCNNHFSEGPIRPYVPAMIEIGGIQIKNEPDPLPEDIANFLNHSNPHGTILFSLGSNMKSEYIKLKTVQIIFKTLAGLKQNVIWKWENVTTTPGKSRNILYKTWLPQDDILAHINTKLFITHAGKGGIAEAQYHGVPMLAFPLFGDQQANADKIESAGYGLQLDMDDLTAERFENTLAEILNNPKYAQNVKRFSQLYRDRPLTAQASVVYWSEYVMRHHGAPHMQSALLYLNFLQASSLDVIGFLCLISYVGWRIIKFIFIFAYRAIREKNVSKIKTRYKLN